MQETIEKLDRGVLLDSYRRNRARSAEIFGLIVAEAFYDRPIPLRHPFAFYEGHIPAFSFLTLNERGLNERPIDERLERIFERGIDPGSLDDARRHSRADWPSRDEIAAFARDCDERVERAMTHARIEDASVPRLVRGQAAYTMLEHEQMHHETLVYIVHQLDQRKKRRVAQTFDDHAPPSANCEPFRAGTATLGADPRRDRLRLGQRVRPPRSRRAGVRDRCLSR